MKIGLNLDNRGAGATSENMWRFAMMADRLDFSSLAVSDLSLSRLNHRLPRSQAHPEVVQSTTEFHDEITDALLPQADAVFDDTTALDTAVDMLDAQPTVMQRLVGHMLLPCQLLTAGFLRRHQDLDLRECEGQEAEIL
jgi:hypothetical protein